MVIDRLWAKFSIDLSTFTQELQPFDRKGLEISEKPAHLLLSIPLLFHLFGFQLKEFQKGGSYRRVGFLVSVYTGAQNSGLRLLREFETRRIAILSA
jgi:hypothetical protein